MIDECGIISVTRKVRWCLCVCMHDEQHSYAEYNVYIWIALVSLYRIWEMTCLQQHTQATLTSLTCLWRDLTSNQTSRGMSVCTCTCVVHMLIIPLILILHLGHILLSSQPRSCVGPSGNGEAPHSEVQMWLAKDEQGSTYSVQAQSMSRNCTASNAAIVLVLYIRIFAGRMDTVTLCYPQW